MVNQSTKLFFSDQSNETWCTVGPCAMPCACACAVFFTTAALDPALGPPVSRLNKRNTGSQTPEKTWNITGLRSEISGLAENAVETETCFLSGLQPENFQVSATRSDLKAFDLCFRSQTCFLFRSETCFVSDPRPVLIQVRDLLCFRSGTCFVPGLEPVYCAGHRAELINSLYIDRLCLRHTLAKSKCNSFFTHSSLLSCFRRQLHIGRHQQPSMCLALLADRWSCLQDMRLTLVKQ